MPKLEPKLIQKELEQGLLWPVYWLYGTERMKSRELLKRIRKAVLGEGASSGASLLSLAEENLDATETDAASILDAAQSPSFGGGARFIVVREAHALKNPDALSELLGPRAKLEDLMSVCVFLSKDLDGRKKFSKTLVEKAAVVPCEEVAEAEREAWIQYLSKRRGVELPPEGLAQLTALDPWSLDIIDQELEKYSLATLGAEGSGSASEVFLQKVSLAGGADYFLNAFFSRDLKSAMERVDSFAQQPDEALPLLGLLAWNVRQLALIAADQKHGTRTVKLNPYLAEKLQRWANGWKLEEILELQSDLAELDFSFKQTPLLPLGLWDSLVVKFCRSAVLK